MRNIAVVGFPVRISRLASSPQNHGTFCLAHLEKPILPGSYGPFPRPRLPAYEASMFGQVSSEPQHRLWPILHTSLRDPNRIHWPSLFPRLISLFLFLFLLLFPLPIHISVGCDEVLLHTSPAPSPGLPGKSRKPFSAPKHV